MDKLRIFLGDLTYDTVAISTEAMPLNVGYVASYCKKKFGDRVEILLFKYIKLSGELTYFALLSFCKVRPPKPKTLPEKL